MTEYLIKLFISNPYEGNKLVFFVNRDSNNMKELESINFPEDGGQIVKGVVESDNNGNVLIVQT